MLSAAQSFENQPSESGIEEHSKRAAVESLFVRGSLPFERGRQLARRDLFRTLAPTIVEPTAKRTNDVGSGMGDAADRA